MCESKKLQINYLMYILVRELCKVLYPYQPTNEDELELKDGDVITVLTKDLPDKGWWKGELKGKIGVFPDNFVVPITQECELIFLFLFSFIRH